LSRGRGKRRFRLHRRRRDGSVVGAMAEGGEVVAQFGCCLLEAVGSLGVLVGLLLVPTYLWLS
jgi:hypothetical protein